MQPVVPSANAAQGQTSVANQITAVASHNVNVCMLKHGHIIPIVAVLVCLFISSIVTVQREIAFLAGIHNDTAVAPTAQPPTSVPPTPIPATPAPATPTTTSAPSTIALVTSAQPQPPPPPQTTRNGPTPNRRSLADEQLAKPAT